MNDDDIVRLIDVTRNPVECCQFYHRDYARDVCDCLEELVNIRSARDDLDLVKKDVIANLANEDELEELTDMLKYCLTENVNKSEIISTIEEVVEMIHEKQALLNDASDYIRELLK